MKLFVKSFAVVFLLLGTSLSPVSAKSDSLSTSTFKNCSRLNKVYPRGVAISASKARIQKVKPTISRSVYNRNKKLDRDRDGTACEVSSSRNKPTTVVPVSPVTTVAQHVCPTGTWSFRLTSLVVDFTLPTTYSGVSSYFFTVFGEFTNSTNAVLFPNSMSTTVNFAPNLQNTRRVYLTSPAEFSLLLRTSGFEVKPGETGAVSGTGVLESLSPPTLGSGNIPVMWNDPKNVAFCPAPIQGQ